MDYVMLVTEDKLLLSTQPIPIWRGEEDADRIKFLFRPQYADTIPVLQAILPDRRTGLIEAMTFEDEPYEGHLVA